MKNANDPRNTLIWDFIRVVKDFQPEFFIMENVTGLATLHDGKVFDAVMNEYVKLRYNISYGVIFAADFGVPQMRKRLIIMGSRTGRAPNLPEPTHKDPRLDDLFSKEKPAYVTCGEAIGDLPPILSGETATRYTRKPKTAFQILMRKGSQSLHNHQASKHSEETSNYYGLIPPGGTPLDIPAHLRNKKQGVQRWPLDGLSRTITTEPTDFLHPTLNRTPTVRETARIQTFPDKYVFLGQRTTGNKLRRLGYCSQTQQVGNAVPPILAKAIGESIANLIR
jgi:DNA (cytosine-5)-methyltransferase 1